MRTQPSCLVFVNLLLLLLLYLWLCYELKTQKLVWTFSGTNMLSMRGIYAQNSIHQSRNFLAAASAGSHLSLCIKSYPFRKIFIHNIGPQLVQKAFWSRRVHNIQLLIPLCESESLPSIARPHNKKLSCCWYDDRYNVVRRHILLKTQFFAAVIGMKAV